MRFSFDRTRLAQTAVVASTNLAALALLATIGAYWTWLWFGPQPQPRSMVQMEAERQPAYAFNLFGTRVEDSVAPAVSSSSVRLLGVVAATGGREAYALVMLDSKEIVAARKGDEVAPGATLVEVAVDHIVLDRNGSRESIAWPEKVVPPNNPPQRSTR